MTALPQVAVVILNWNGKHHLAQFLPSVLASQWGNLRVIVADNGSTDDSVAFVRAGFPAVEIIQLPQNYGFARGYNEALRQVQSDYYVLLNSDVEVTPGWIAPVVGLLEQTPGAAAAQPKLLAFHQRDHFEYAGGAGGWLDHFGYPFSRGRVFDVTEEDNGQYDAVQPVFWASGAALFIRASVYHELGGLDDFFFAHQEEIDLCWRLQRAGYTAYCCPQSVVYHVGGGTLPKGNSRKTFLNFRNNHIMLAKNLSPAERWWRIPYRILLDQVAALKGLLGGDSGYFVAINRAHFAFYKWCFSKKERSSLPRPRLRTMQGVYHGNVIWDHFVKGKKKFSEIVGRF
ncbi:glycosyltransferase family 2 protein [Flaviaesturariibacter flavus]|uniref:Glycosyltransferase family 2 protein n=1 Tax=Flaviaesturariibacter flavus TaxID=2502780 RepID=A0A4R1BPK0_9BACT|nr:glycosyltransferase family 2 protein [Flaviaesturariibacter flavus]TCJ19549.1 glycosyltransferase family 2 protein [Flaviaesturariibacter flavus]